ncbi:BON domain-containing protein [Peredibacter sp. HCB2-198]|uniref:BON domain-containing protein n=1 Tax=Peredibacter sp. HCB2-198 TaxID=3383025 RepID=UPI0038B52902
MEPNKEPGVSGKERSGKTWINPEEYEAQKEFADTMEEAEKGFQSTGQNLHGRSDLSNQGAQVGVTLTEDAVIEALRRSPQVDISNLIVSVKESVVHLEGLVEDMKELREMESIANNVPGVSKVVSHVELKKDDSQELRDIQ